MGAGSLQLAGSGPSGSTRIEAEKKPRTFHYRAFGLHIASDVPLPDLLPADPAVADLSIKLDGPCLDPPRVHHSIGLEEQVLAWPMIGTIRISGGNSIAISRIPGVDDKLLAQPLLGPVMAVLLQMRGLLVLHASALSVHGTAVAFAGDKGAGKSTTAAALVRAGHALLTDDVLPIDLPASGGAFLEAGFPRIKLTDSAADRLRSAETGPIPVIHPLIGKRELSAPERFTAQRMPLQHVFLLGRGEKAACARLAQGEALTAALRFSYVMRFGQEALKKDLVGRHFARCAAFADRVAVHRLTVPEGLDRLDEIAPLVEHVLSENSGGQP